MYLENVVVDALDPQRLGRFWEAVIGGERLTDVPEGFETRLALPDGPELDLCFQRVPDAPTGPPRLHLDVAGGEDPEAEVARLVALGAGRVDDGWSLTDPEGHPFQVLPGGPSYDGTGPVAALRLDSADPDRDAGFWARLSGWTPVPDAPRSLRHPSGRGPLLVLAPEPSPKTVKSRRHLDLRLESGDDPDALARTIAELGGHALVTDWGDLPWRSYTDPSGNELCLLRAPS